MNTRFNRILFDYDGTLIIHNPRYQGEQLAKRLGIAEEQFEEFYIRISKFFNPVYASNFYSNKKMTRELYEYIISVAMHPIEQFGITAQKLLDTINDNTKYVIKLAPNAKETLEYLANKGYELCLFTNWFGASQIESMKYHGIYDYFERVYSWDDYYCKPDKRAIKRALAGTDPATNIMVGDNLVMDIAPANEYGIYTIGYNVDVPKDSKIYPKVIITDLAILQDLL